MMRFDFGRLLESRLSSRDLELMRGAAAQAEARGFPVYIVGGVLRDLALGGPATDLDLVVEGDAILLARALAVQFGGHVVSHTRFGTARWELLHKAASRSAASLGPRDHIDLISARSEKYKGPGQLPQVKLGSIDDDLRRRDFTINTLALRLDRPHFGEIHDPFGAQSDLDRGIIRALHPDSFAHDPTRIYRAVRYEARYGFKMAPETLALIPGARQHVSALSSQRIRHELDLILDEDRARRMLSRLASLDLLRPVHAALPSGRSTLRRLEAPVMPSAHDELGPQRRDLRWMLWLMDLHAAQIRLIDRRLRFRRQLLQAVLAAAAIYKELPVLVHRKPSRVTSYLDKYPLSAVQAVHQAATTTRAKAVLTAYLSRWRDLKPETGGRRLKELGLAPGPVYGEILGELRNAWLDGAIASPAEEAELLRVLVERLRRRRKPVAAAPLRS
jgi:tRNA nucleotidyltransferase (CCA-adding enzyme)